MAPAGRHTRRNGKSATSNVAVVDNPIARLSSLLSTRAHDFLEPTPDLQEIAIQAAKAALDPVASRVINAQIERRRGNSRKRKRHDDGNEEQVLQIKQIHTAGFGAKQVWEQARRVLDAACLEIERTLQTRESQLASSKDEHGQPTKVQVAGDGDDSGIEDDEVGSTSQNSNHQGLSDDELDAEDDEISNGEDIEADSDIQLSSDDEALAKTDTFVQDPNGLNDGFFSIDDFNKQTQVLEQMDARGDDDNPSDEDEVDWDADPLAMSLGGLSNRKSGSNPHDQNDEDDEDEDDEDGPGLSDAHLDDLEDDDDLDMDENPDLDGGFGLSNANDIRYSDFFEPPPKKPSKTKRMRALPKTQPQSQDKPQEDVQKDVERAMADVRRDLLDSEDEDDFDDDPEDASDDDAPPRPRAKDSNMSTHEKQRATIAAEIRRLEAANVSKRDWQLSGEARAADRPINSLLEEDLEFERAGKPVPVVTAETSEEIEQLIKRRILAREFDEVVRRSAVGIGSANDTRRGRIELDDSKPQASLGELYEQDHLKATNPASYVDKRTAATKKQHDQIDILWREVNEQLNLLSNLHFKPRRVDIEMKTIEDKPRIAMEDARPVGELESGEGGALAPQEVYRPGGIDTKTQPQITTSRSGASQNKEELSREEKLRRRRREKERSKKAQANKAQIILGKTTKSSSTSTNTVAPRRQKPKHQEQSDIISDLKKGNVKVVGKDGALQNISKTKKGGALHRDANAAMTSGGNLKL